MMDYLANSSDAPPLTAAERQALERWNATAQDYPRDRSVAELFAAQAARTPDHVALVRAGSDGQEQRLTYQALDERATQLAHSLQTLGVGPDVPVAVCLRRSFEFVIALLAVIKAGGAYVPLDPALPDERLRFMLADTGAPVLLTEQALSERLPGGSAVIRLDADAARLAAASKLPPASRTQPDNLAYIIYTSGSTGTPKGVQVTQAGLLNLVFWHQQSCQITSDDRAGLVAGLGFDALVLELWPYLTAGATLYLPDDETRLNPARLLKWLHVHALTRMFAPTPMAEALMQQPWSEPGDPWEALRTLLTGGDQLRQYPDPRVRCEVVNNYGPTETTVVATVATYTSDSADPQARGLPPIGRPISNTQVYVLDRQLQQQPPGVVGELYIGGVGVARGYLNAPALTAERFVPDPFSATPGARLYKTGDLVRYRSDGNLEFLGRIDGQVKLRGYRIELGEIEAVLVQHPAVHEAVAVVREDQPPAGGHPQKRLVAYVVEQQNGRPVGTQRNNPADSDHSGSLISGPCAPQDLSEFLGERLPAYMVPSAFVFLDALPLTVNGKIDRNALPAPEQSQRLPDRQIVAPRTALEEVLGQFWIEVLGVERVGVFDSFFELGGHSLLATQIATRVQQVLRVELPVGQLFESPTIAGLAQIIRANEATPGHAEKVAQLLIRIKGMSTADLKQTLQQKRSQ
ncbi:MAG TPA: non-ribosomal peptide synthetase [Herpetosiphonaceae bacterium]